MRRRKSGSKSCRPSTRWVPASNWRATTSTSAAPATFWARNSRATSAKLVDRFGKMPAEAEFMLSTVALKLLCRAAGVEKIDAGEKAIVLSFHDNKFERPERLIAWIQKNAPLVRLRPDHRVIVQRVWTDDRQRLSGVSALVAGLAKLAGASDATETGPPAARSAAASR